MKKVYIIAEAGVNHNGSLNLAKQLIDVAAKAGADAVKFQTFKAENVLSAIAKKADYQIKNTNLPNETQLEMAKKFEFKFDVFQELKSYATNKGIFFISSPFDLESVDFLAHEMEMSVIKIPSGEITNLPYLRLVGSKNRKVIMSTGMSTLAEIQYAIDVLCCSGTERENITLLHCNTEYPTPMQDVNLLAMQKMKEAFALSVGYSDHTTGIEIPIAAVAMGACMIEKHFTLDQAMAGPDHKASLNPEELNAMVCAIRNIEKAMGSGEKMPSHSEEKNIVIARKSLVAAVDIEKGQQFSKENITVKRPGNGISPTQWDDVMGSTAKKAFCRDELIEI